MLGLINYYAPFINNLAAVRPLEEGHQIRMDRESFSYHGPGEGAAV